MRIIYLFFCFYICRRVHNKHVKVSAWQCIIIYNVKYFGVRKTGRKTCQIAKYDEQPRNVVFTYATVLQMQCCGSNLIRIPVQHVAGLDPD